MTKTMNKGGKYYFFATLRILFLTVMLLFAAVPLLQVFINSFRTDREVKPCL